MLFAYINSSQRSADIDFGSLKIVDQLQQRSNTCSFSVFSGTKPEENQELRVFMGDTIASAAGAVMTLNGKFETNVGKFYAGQRLYIRIADADEEIVTVQSYVESTLTLTLTAAPSGSVVAGDKIGELIFGGVVARVVDRNEGALNQIEYDVTGIDYSKIFNKKRVTDSWEEEGAQYIINSFLNSTVNYNATLDTLDYADNTAIQAEYTESGDGGNPTIDSAEYIEGDASAVFGWTNSSGLAHWTGSPTSRDISHLVGATSGAPTKGRLMLWSKTSSQANITGILIKIGSSASDYVEFTLTLGAGTGFTYWEGKFATAGIAGTPDWTAADFVKITILETGNGSIQLNGLRVNAEGSFTMNNVEDTSDLSSFRSANLLPTDVLSTLAKKFSYVYYIDYERDVHFAPNETLTSPISFTDNSNNFNELSVEVDQSQLGNRIKIFGGETESASTYAQVIEGDGVLREWVLKSKFKNLEVTIDNNTSTDTMEAGTNTTTVNATAHGLLTGDHIVNRTRNNAVRQITKITDNQFTVEAVPSQTNGDTFSKFSVTPTLGLEGITDETTVDYVQNSNEKSVRATAATATLIATEFIRFEYNERVKVQFEYTDPTSADALKALGFGDGIFELDPITDENITDTITAVTLAQAQVAIYSNPLITGSIKTDQHGIQSGQLLTITDSNRGIDTQYLVQRVRFVQKAGKYKDYFEYEVTFGTTLFGVIEFYQKLLADANEVAADEDVQIIKFIAPQEEVDCADVNAFAPAETISNIEAVDCADTQIVDDTLYWYWEDDAGANTFDTRWGVFHWSDPPVPNSYSLDLETSSGQYASITDAAQTGLNITGDMTVEFWVNVESFTSLNSIVTKYNATGAQRSYIFGFTTTEIRVVLSVDGAATVTKNVTYTVDSGIWKHIAYVYDAAAGECEIFVNGSSVGTMTGLPTSIFDSSADFIIGRVTSGTSYDGLLDDVRVWNDKRTSTEIADNYNVHLNGTEANLVGYWRFNNDYTDETTNGNDLTATGSPVFDTDVPF